MYVLFGLFKVALCAGLALLVVRAARGDSRARSTLSIAFLALVGLWVLGIFAWLYVSRHGG